MELGDTPMLLTPTELEMFITDEIEKWAKVIESSGVKLDLPRDILPYI